MGISPSAKSPNVMIFSSESGAQYGYVDDWYSDASYHYTGEGQQGDQTMDHGNRAVLEHRSDGRHLRLFEGSGGVIKYLGEFSIDSRNPYYETDASDKHGEIRQVIVFRLRPDEGDFGDRDSDAWNPPPLSDQASSVVSTAIEQSEKDVYSQGAQAGKEATRREAKLVEQYVEYRNKAKFPPLVRLKIKPTGEAAPLFTDLFSEEENLLIEAKGSVSRPDIRMAVGQLFDYRRFCSSEPKLAVLLPELPRSDLCNFLGAVGISIIYKGGDGNFLDHDL